MTTLRGKSRSEIQRNALRQKFLFVATLLKDSDTLTAAASVAGVLPQQVRRWRIHDPIFNRIVDYVEALISGDYTEEEYQEMVVNVRAYLVGLKQELKSHDVQPTPL